LLTVKQLLRKPGNRWTAKPSDQLSSLEILSWHAASDLADFVEMTIEIEDLPTVWPDVWTTLFGLEAYFKAIRHPLSQSHALVMLMLERVSRGLTPRGDDEEPPIKGA
jgi:hypothetical protein